jgi:hypothetical protein
MTTPAEVEPPPPAPPSAADAAALPRSRQYLRLLVIAAVLGVPISAVAYWYLVLAGVLQDALYKELPGSLGLDAIPAWGPLPLLGIAVAALVSLGFGAVVGPERRSSRSAPRTAHRARIMKPTAARWSTGTPAAHSGSPPFAPRRRGSAECPLARPRSWRAGGRRGHGRCAHREQRGRFGWA